MKKIATGDRRFIITKNLIMMLVMLVVIFVAIFAWFSYHNEVTAGGASVSIKSVDNVEIAVPDKITVNGKVKDSFPTNNDKWTSDLEFYKTGYLKNLVKDVTSNGKQFVMPNFEAAKELKDGRKVIVDDVWVDGLSSKEALINDSNLDDDQYNYISFDFYVRSKVSTITVLPDSFLAAGSELGFMDEEHQNQEKKSLKGRNIYRCSSYGAQEGEANAFSADAVVGAMRVSLVGALVDEISTNQTTHVTTETSYNGGTWNNNSALRFLWLPRPDVYLKTANNSDDWTLITGLKPSGNSAQGGLSASEVDAIAQKSYCHSFYEGNLINGNVKKGLTGKKYWDPANYASGATAPEGAVTSETFKVSKTKDLENSPLGTTGYVPTLGQSARISGTSAEENLNKSKSIQFVPGSDPEDDTTGYYVYKYTLNIWIEGEDAEARRSMNSGVFSLELYFGS